MIPFDITFGFIVGLVIAFLTKDKLEQETNWYFNKYIYVFMAWLAFIYGPLVYWFQSGWPFWNTMYFLEDIPAYVITIYATSVLLIGALGFVLAHKFIREEKSSLVPIIIVTSAILISLFLMAFSDRVLYVGTFQEWETGTAVILWESSLFPVFLIAGSIILVTLILVVIYLRKL